MSRRRSNKELPQILADGTYVFPCVKAGGNSLGPAKPGYIPCYETNAFDKESVCGRIFFGEAGEFSVEKERPWAWGRTVVECSRGIGGVGRRV